MARPSNTDERRREIALGLRKVMAKKGYDGASIGDVALAAKLTPGLVHYHFKNKLEILLAVLDGLVEAHMLGLETALAKAGDDPGRQIDAFIHFHLAVGANADPEALACWITLSGEALKEARVRKAFAAAIGVQTDRLAAIIANGVAAKAFRTSDAQAAAAALIATMQGYFVLAATAREVIPSGSAARAATLMANGLLQRSAR